MEGFPWTQVAGVALPEGHKPAVDLSDRDQLSPEAFKERLGDGSFGGYYGRPEADLLAVWDVAVEETREIIGTG